MPPLLPNEEKTKRTDSQLFRATLGVALKELVNIQETFAQTDPNFSTFIQLCTDLKTYAQDISTLEELHLEHSHNTLSKLKGIIDKEISSLSLEKNQLASYKQITNILAQCIREIDLLQIKKDKILSEANKKIIAVTPPPSWFWTTWIGKLFSWIASAFRYLFCCESNQTSQQTPESSVTTPLLAQTTLSPDQPRSLEEKQSEFLKSKYDEIIPCLSTLTTFKQLQSCQFFSRPNDELKDIDAALEEYNKTYNDSNDLNPKEMLQKIKTLIKAIDDYATLKKVQHNNRKIELHSSIEALREQAEKVKSYWHSKLVTSAKHPNLLNISSGC